MTGDDGQNFADELNEFYSRFDKDSTPDVNTLFKNDNFTSFDDDVLIFTQEDTCRVFRSPKANKSQGPDNISPKLMKTCAQVLS